MSEPKSEPNPHHKGVVGLQNMGNTCYANSTIQLLRAVPELNAFVLREDLEEACQDKNNDHAHEWFTAMLGVSLMVSPDDMV